MRASASDLFERGANRSFIFCNNPRNQRKAHCQNCGIVIPREVPRIKLDCSYHYGAGYYCMSCGVKQLRRKKKDFETVKGICSRELENLESLLEIAEEVMADEFYPKKMALAKMLQVLEE